VAHLPISFTPDFRSFSEEQGILEIDTEISRRDLDLREAQMDLDRKESPWPCRSSTLRPAK
jgi:hypothetical protein